MKTMRLRYTGVEQPVFQDDGVGLVEPGGEFSVPQDRVVAYMRRADIEHAGECPAPPCRCGDEPQAEAVPEAGSGTPGTASRRRRNAADSAGSGEN